MIDQFEMAILEILTEDARTSMSSIAMQTGRSEADVKNAIERMELENIIVKYPAMVNWDAVDVEQVEALIEVKVAPQRGEGYDAIAEQIYRFEEVSSVYLMSGAYDLMVLMRGKTLKELALFVTTKLSTLEHVTSTATHFVLKRYKDNGVILTEQKHDKRLVVSP